MQCNVSFQAFDIDQIDFEINNFAIVFQYHDSYCLLFEALLFGLKRAVAFDGRIYIDQ